MQVLVDFQENPKAAQEHTKNPMVMNKIQKLISAGIVQMRWIWRKMAVHAKMQLTIIPSVTLIFK